MAKRRKERIVCRECGSEDVRSSVTYNTYWNFETQEWDNEDSADYDHPTYCVGCQTDTALEWVFTIQLCLFADGDYNTIYEETDYDE